MTDPTRSGPLAGLIVADFSRVLAGPYCTMLLADLEADVIKVESPGADDTRTRMPPVAEDGVSTYYLSIDAARTEVAENRRHPAQGQEPNPRAGPPLGGRRELSRDP